MKLLLVILLSISTIASVEAEHSKMQEIVLEKEMDQLLLLIQKRLAVMHEVAMTKWNQGLAIEDKVREQQILKDLSARAEKNGLDPQRVVQFFDAQIEAAKAIQRSDFAIWQAEGKGTFENVLSLKDDLRAYIDLINDEMILQLGKIHGFKGVLNQPISARTSDAVECAIWQQAIQTFR